MEDRGDSAPAPDTKTREGTARPAILDPGEARKLPAAPRPGWEERKMSTQRLIRVSPIVLPAAVAGDPVATSSDTCSDASQRAHRLRLSS